MVYGIGARPLGVLAPLGAGTVPLPMAWPPLSVWAAVSRGTLRTLWLYWRIGYGIARSATGLWLWSVYAASGAVPRVGTRM